MKGGLSAPHRRSALKVFGSEDGGFLGLSPQAWRGIAISAGLGLGAAAFANRGRIQQSLRGGRARVRNWANRRIRHRAAASRSLNPSGIDQVTMQNKVLKEIREMEVPRHPGYAGQKPYGKDAFARGVMSPDQYAKFELGQRRGVIRTEPLTADDITRMNAADARATNTYYDALDSATAPIDWESKYVPN